MSSYAPICLFTYKRLNETKQTVSALKENNLAKKSDLIIFSDGPKTESDIKAIQELRDYLTTISGFRTIKIYESVENKGLAKSIIHGVSKVLNQYQDIIVVEDDLKTSTNFLDFMNQGLNFYKNNSNVISISGYTMPLAILESIDKDYYYGIRASSWGWGTWKHVWNAIDWEVKDFESFISVLEKRRDFNKGGSDMSSMLKKTIEGKISSWAIKFCYHQWKQKMVTVFPKESKIENIGFSETASNTKYVIPEFRAILDDSNNTNFYFDKEVKVEDKIMKAFAFNFSKYVRAKNKFYNLFRNGFR